MCHIITKTENDHLMFSSSSVHHHAGAAVDGTPRFAASRAADFSWALRKSAASGTQAADRSSLRVLGQALKVSKVLHRIRKPSLSLPAIQFKPPVIIHTYSPEIIHTEPESFMSLVQKLTGSSDTRLRLNDAGSASNADHADNADALLQQDAEGLYGARRRHEHQSELQAAAVTSASFVSDPCRTASPDDCSSPSTSSFEEENSRFASSGVTAKNTLKQCDSSSPKGPLPSYGSDQQDMGAEFLNSTIFFSASVFDQQVISPATSNASSVIKREPLSPTFSFSDLTFLAAEPGFDAEPRTSCSNSSTSLGLGAQRSQQQLDHQVDQMMSFSAGSGFGASHGTQTNSYIDVSYPNCFASTTPGNYNLSPGLTGDNNMLLPSLSPSYSTAMWSPSFLDCLNTTTSISPAASPIPFTHSSYSPTSGTNLVSLRDIQAMNDDLLRGF